MGKIFGAWESELTVQLGVAQCFAAGRRAGGHQQAEKRDRKGRKACTGVRGQSSSLTGQGEGQVHLVKKYGFFHKG